MVNFFRYREHSMQRPKVKLAVLLNQQASQNLKIRCDAISQLKNWSSSEAKNIIRQSLSDTSSQVRCTAVHAISAWSEFGTFDLLEHRFRVDASGRVRAAVAFVVSNWDGERSQKLLVRALRDKEPRVRAAAAGSLFNYSHQPKVFVALLNALPDSNYSVRDYIRRALVRASSLYNENPPSSDTQIIVEKLLDDSGNKSRFLVALSLCKWQLPLVRQNLQEGFWVLNTDMRLACFSALSVWTDEEGHCFVEAALSDSEPEIRTLAAFLLINFAPTPSSLDALILALSDESSIVCVNAKHTLGQWHDLHTLRRLTSAMFYGTTPTRQALHSIMRKWGDPKNVLTIVEEVFEEHHQGSAGRHRLWQYRHPLMFKAFRIEVDHGSQVQRVIEIIGQWNLIDALDLVIHVLDNKSHAVMHEAKKALARWTSSEIPQALVVLLMQDLEDKRTALACLKNTNDINAQEVVLTALDHDVTSIQKRAAETILEWNQPEVLLQLKRKLRDSNRLVSIPLIKLFESYRHPFLLKFWLESLRFREADVSAIAIKVLNGWRDDVVLAKLISSLQNEEHYVFEHASAALRGWQHPSIPESLVDACITAVLRNPKISSWTPAYKQNWRCEYPQLRDILLIKLAEIDRQDRWPIYFSFFNGPLEKMNSFLLLKSKHDRERSLRTEFHRTQKVASNDFFNLISIFNLNNTPLNDLVVHGFIPDLEFLERCELLLCLALRNPDSIKEQIKQSISRRDQAYIDALVEVIRECPQVAKALEYCGSLLDANNNVKN